MTSSGAVIGLIGADIYTSTNSGSSFSTFWEYIKLKKKDKFNF